LLPQIRALGVTATAAVSILCRCCSGKWWHPWADAASPLPPGARLLGVTACSMISWSWAVASERQEPDWSDSTPSCCPSSCRPSLLLMTSSPLLVPSQIPIDRPRTESEIPSQFPSPRTVRSGQWKTMEEGDRGGGAAATAADPGRGSGGHPRQQQRPSPAASGGRKRRRGDLTAPTPAGSSAAAASCVIFVRVVAPRKALLGNLLLVTFPAVEATQDNLCRRSSRSESKRCPLHVGTDRNLVLVLTNSYHSRLNLTH
jgi:hypothetical protein